MRREVERLAQDKQRLQEKLARLEAALEASRRAGKRQAAPFSKGEPQSHPRRPGRRPEAAHGPSAFRPPPQRVDEIPDASLPECCPHCGGTVEHDKVAQQFQAEVLPVMPRVTQFQVHVGHCQQCGRRLQGRHPRQTSNALGAAASQLGPRALAVAADLHTGLGLPLAKVCRIFDRAFSLAISRGGLCLGLQRLARTTMPTYQGLIEQVRGSPVVCPDETGWKLGGWLVWLWAFATETLTVYAIQPGRGFAQAATILGEDFAGILVRDAWAPYRQFEQAEHTKAAWRICCAVATAAQVDWADFGRVRIGRAERRLSAFLMTLCYSRALYVEFFFDQSLANFLRGHVRAFEHFAGVVRQVATDNLRSVVLERRGDQCPDPLPSPLPRAGGALLLRAAALSCPARQREGTGGAPCALPA
ncbi:MAG TPA: transposase [Thermoanaerobaculia bacterium]|nr:transposase [Thermoanaerobaculia bacterium]